jgi:UDP-N-acetylmuramate--alanine ligase
MHPSFLVGSELNEVGTNAGLDSGEWLIVEADESDGTFLRLGLDAAIVTNIDHDHLWYWGDMDRLEDAFRNFVDAVDGPVVLCADDPNTSALAAERPGAITYGWSERARYRARDYEGGRGGSSFVLDRDGEELGEIRLPVVGRHNAQNAAGAAAMTLEVGVDFASVQNALAGFGGVARRFQHRGELEGVTMIDDYALLPPEIQATIRAASEGDWGRIIAVFQPFRYARTALMWREFADAFVGADQVILTDVCGFHEQPIPGVTGHLIVNAVLDAHPDTPVAYFPHRAELIRLVPGYARAGDLVLTLGGGDITTLADDLLAEAQARGAGE